ncbi:MAG: hypothetical protein N2255_05365 [Kiritimatiellae bacterium]|nr:hypothetical protein [Kiritimatiellia bacterium]
MISTVCRRERLEQELDSFDPRIRRRALETLVREYGTGFPTEGTNVNMHMHSFFSYNAENHSPTRLAWEARQKGLYAAGLCDFDVLDGLEEFHEVGLLLKLRTATHLETRVFLHEYRGVEINSPGEPGVAYMMAGSVPRVPALESAEAAMLARLRWLAAERNRALVHRINSELGEIAIDYEGEVVSLTPSGTPTERHIVRAYIRKATEVFRHADEVARFWASVLRVSFDEAVELLAEPVALENAVRSGFIKKGGLGYVQPTEASFPAAEDFIRWSRNCGAIPMLAWLDGTTAAEKDPDALLDHMGTKGVLAINIIPERNWNVRDRTEREIKRENLATIVQLAEKRGMPLNIGTELNRSGLPFVDDLDGEVLRAYRDVFMKGARIMVGHAVLARYAGFPYGSTVAVTEFPSVVEQNSFFEAVGRLSPLGVEDSDRLLAAGPARAFSLLWAAAREIGWRKG